MIVNIISDGTPLGTRIVDAGTGEYIKKVTSLELKITPLQMKAEIKILVDINLLIIFLIQQ